MTVTESQCTELPEDSAVKTALYKILDSISLIKHSPLREAVGIYSKPHIPWGRIGYRKPGIGTHKQGGR